LTTQDDPIEPAMEGEGHEHFRQFGAALPMSCGVRHDIEQVERLRPPVPSVGLSRLPCLPRLYRA